MISRTQFIALDGQAAHLLNTDNNKRVLVRAEFVRNSPLDLLEATRVFAAIARTNLRTTRDLVHTKISPAHTLSDAELAHALQLIEEAFGIASTMPRFVVQHSKGDRPDHFHVLWPIVDPTTGRAVKSNDNFLQDELVSRRLELQFGEPITPGPRMIEVIEILQAQGLQVDADRLREHEAVRAGDRLDTGSRQQAARLKVDALVLGREIYRAWTSANDGPQAFERKLAAMGMRLAAGDRAVMVVHDRTAYAAPLGRLLRQHAKAAGTPLLLPEREMQKLFPNLPALTDAKATGLTAAAAGAKLAVAQELRFFVEEAEMDGDKVMRKRLAGDRAAAKKRVAAETRETLKSRRDAIRAEYRRRDRIRRARVGRAFLAANLLGTPSMRKFAFKAVAAGVVLAGGGLGFALILGGVAMMALPSRERARAVAYHAKLERAADGEGRRRALLSLYEEHRADEVRKRRNDVDLIAQLDSGARRLAAKYAHLILARGETSVPDNRAEPIDQQIERRLGNAVVSAIRRQLYNGAGIEVLDLLCNRGTEPANTAGPDRDVSKAPQSPVRTAGRARRDVGWER